MDTKSKLERLHELFKMRSEFLVVVPITVSGEEAFMIGQEHPTDPSRIAPLAFVLPDEIGMMFMDSTVFREVTAIPDADLPGPSETDDARTSRETSRVPTPKESLRELLSALDEIFSYAAKKRASKTADPGKATVDASAEAENLEGGSAT